jgi:hypothetical protein
MGGATANRGHWTSRWRVIDYTRWLLESLKAAIFVNIRLRGRLKSATVDCGVTHRADSIQNVWAVVLGPL